MRLMKYYQGNAGWSKVRAETGISINMNGGYEEK